MDVIAFRLPGEQEKFIYKAENVGLSLFGKDDCFIISPFDPEKASSLYKLQTRLYSFPEDIIIHNDLEVDFKEFAQDEYLNYIETIKQCLDGKEEKKIVASRRTKIKGKIDCNRLFNSLCHIYPDAFVVLFSTREFGTWCGASPELLLSKEGNILYTMSLAGTRAPETKENWDRKNLLEQEIVTKFITSTFKNNNIKYSVGDTVTIPAGGLEHIMTSITGEVKKETKLLPLLKALSPTPALSGYPREEAVEIIKSREGDRLLYGGFCGPVYFNGDFRLNVILRCCFCTAHETVLFAGGGITIYSDPMKEWIETENKLKTIKKVL